MRLGRTKRMSEIRSEIEDKERRRKEEEDKKRRNIKTKTELWRTKKNRKERR